VNDIVFTSIIRKEGSNLVLPGVTESDIFAEETLKASGVPYTLARQAPFVESLQFYITDKSLRRRRTAYPAGKGKTSTASRDDLGAAHADRSCPEPGHENKIYRMSAGSPRPRSKDMARILSDVRGKKVPYVIISDQEYIANHTKEGIPEPLAEWVLNWVRAMNLGEFDEVNGDLERLIGHKPLSTAEYLKGQLSRRRARDRSHQDAAGVLAARPRKAADAEPASAAGIGPRKSHHARE